MGAVMTLFLGVDTSEVFFADLPCDFDPNDTSSVSPSNWFLANFSADVLSSSGCVLSFGRAVLLMVLQG